MGSSIESILSMYRFLLEIAKAKYETDMIDANEFLKELDDLEARTRSLIKITCQPYYSRNDSRNGEYIQDRINQSIINCLADHE